MKRELLIMIGLLMLQTAIPVAEVTVSDSLTLDQAVELTLQNNPVVDQAEHVVTASGARVDLARSSYYPDVALIGSYTRLGPVASFDQPGGQSFRLYPEDNYDVHLGLRLTLYDFGRTASSVKVAESAHQITSDNADVVKSHLAYQTISVFNAMLILRQSIDVIDEQIQALQQHLEVSKKKVLAGTATDYDTLATRVRIAIAGNERIDAARALEVQDAVFRQLTGLPPEKPVNIKGTFATVAVELDADSLLACAEKQRPELVLAASAENAAVMQRHLASLCDRPSLALNMTSGLKDGYFPDLVSPVGNFTASLQLLVPLFNGHRTRYLSSASQADLLAAQAHTADLRRRIMSEVGQAIAGVQSSHEKIANADLQVEQAEEALTMARMRYEAGVITNLEVLDAETMLVQTKLVRLRAQYDYTVSLNDLDRATGKRVW
jgi:outer membrane protein